MDEQVVGVGLGGRGLGAQPGSQLIGGGTAVLQGLAGIVSEQVEVGFTQGLGAELAVGGAGGLAGGRSGGRDEFVGHDRNVCGYSKRQSSGSAEKGGLNPCGHFVVGP